MNTQMGTKKIVEEINNFLLNPGKGTREIKFDDEVIVSYGELKEFNNEIIIALIRPDDSTKFAIYERKISNFYIIEYIIKTGKQVYIIHMFFLKQDGKYRLHLVNMSRFFEF